MKFNLKGLLVLALVNAIWLLAFDIRWGVAAIVAVTVIDAFSFLAPFIGWPLRDEGTRQNRSVNR